MAAQEGEAGIHQHSEDGVLLTSTGDVVRRWRIYFEDLFKPTNISSIEDAESGDSEEDSIITGVEVTKEINKLHGGMDPGMGEIHLELFKVLDVVQLSWLTCLCNVALTSGAAPLDWQTGMAVPFFKMDDL